MGVEYEEYILEAGIKEKELLELIQKLNNNKEINGILLQSPLPSNLDINEAFRTIDYRKDVDGFHPMNVGKISIGTRYFCFLYTIWNYAFT